MSVATGLAVNTVRRLLEFDPWHCRIRHNTDSALDFGLPAVDETLMVDVTIMRALRPWRLSTRRCPAAEHVSVGSFGSRFANRRLARSQTRNIRTRRSRRS